MKTIVNVYAIQKTENFKNNIRKLLPEAVEIFDFDSLGIVRRRGYGSYKYVLDCKINDKETCFELAFNDSTIYDYYTDLEVGTLKHENFIKKTILNLLENEYIYYQIADFAEDNPFKSGK